MATPDTDTLPVPQPINANPPASAEALPPPEPIAANPLPPPTPVSAETSESALPAPENPAEQPISDNDHSVLSKFKSQIEEPAKAMVTGPGTIVGEGDVPGVFTLPAFGGSFAKSKEAFKKTKTFTKAIGKTEKR